MTDSPSDTTVDAAEEPQGADALSEWTEGLAARLDAADWIVEFDTPRVYVDRSRWVETLRSARDEEGLDFFSWLSAIDWSRESEVGEGVEDPEAVEERFEVICRLSSVKDATGAHFLTVVPKDDPWIDSLVDTWGGAAWHEREAHEMFGIDFRGNPNLDHLYLPDSFEGHPLRKSYPLLSREVKPWPGTVDVEGMPGDDSGPSTENPEA